MANIQKRVSKTGETSYRVQVRLKGHPPETASFERLTDARKWAQHTEAAIREGRHFKTVEAKKHTLAQTIDRYHKEVLAHRDNPVNQNTYLKYWKETLGDYRLADITPSLIVEHRNALVGMQNKYGRTIGLATANRYSQALGHVFTVAMKEWGWINQNPVANIAKYKEPRGRVRFLSDEERAGLLEACKESDNPFLHTVVVLALSTGARKMEILGLKWQDIDFERSQIVLHETKNGERRVLPLQGYALALVREYAKVRTLGCDYVFPSKKASKNAQGKIIYQPIDIRTSWENALKKAGIEDFRFHDLRHSAASYLAMNGASLAEIAEVLGHKTLQMVKRYAHLSEAHTHNVVSKMNERIFGDV
jgi:integrase